MAQWHKMTHETCSPLDLTMVSQIWHKRECLKAQTVHLCYSTYALRRRADVFDVSCQIGWSEFLFSLYCNCNDIGSKTRDWHCWIWWKMLTTRLRLVPKSLSRCKIHLPYSNVITTQIPQKHSLINQHFPHRYLLEKWNASFWLF
jgi:hypothetical protein